MYDALKVAQEYKKVEAKVDQLLPDYSPDLQGMVEPSTRLICSAKGRLAGFWNS